MSLWDYARRTWSDDRIRPGLLALQEDAEQCVPLLLWSLWVGEEGLVVDEDILEKAVKAALPWDLAARELRSARRRLRGVEAKPGLLSMIESATVMAERSLLDQLETLTPPVLDPERPGIEARVTALVAAWGKPVPPDLLHRLLAALHPEPLPDAYGDDPQQAGLRRLLAGLKEEHANLSVAVEMLESTPLPDQLQIARMKRRKLILRDEIVAIENRLTPDIIA